MVLHCPEQKNFVRFFVYSHGAVLSNDDKHHDTKANSPNHILTCIKTESYKCVEMDEELELHLENALAKCLHSLRSGHALQFGLLLVQKTCIDIHTGRF